MPKRRQKRAKAGRPQEKPLIGFKFVKNVKEKDEFWRDLGRPANE